jgi:hypothetical protein
VAADREVATLTELAEIRGRLSAGDYAGAAALARDAIATAQAAGDAATLETLGRELYDLVVVDASTGADEVRRASDEALAAAAGLAAPPGRPGTGHTPAAGIAFEDLAGRARLAVAALAVTMAVAVLTIAVDAWRISLLSTLIHGGGPPTTLDDLARSDDLQGLAATLELVALIACAILFIVWFAPAYRNLRVLGVPDLRFGPGWAIGAWFVPVLNLWRPKQIANDIWRGSDPEAPASLAGELQMRPVASLVTGWWAAWIVSGVIGTVFDVVWADSDLESLRSAATWEIVAELVGILAAGLAMALVRRVTTMQALRHARLTDTA